jgi:hypothetical protein
LPYLEGVLKKHSYRVLEIILPLEADISAIIDVVKTKNVSVIRCDLNRDYGSGTLTMTMVIRLFHKGVTDKHAHSIIKAIEALKTSPRRITWQPRG